MSRYFYKILSESQDHENDINLALDPNTHPDHLDALFDKHDQPISPASNSQQVLRSIISNPSLNFQKLHSMSRRFPEEAMKNPSIPLHILGGEDPREISKIYKFYSRNTDDHPGLDEESEKAFQNGKDFVNPIYYLNLKRTPESEKPHLLKKLLDRRFMDDGDNHEKNIRKAASSFMTDPKHKKEQAVLAKHPNTPLEILSQLTGSLPSHKNKEVLNNPKIKNIENTPMHPNHENLKDVTDILHNTKDLKDVPKFQKVRDKLKTHIINSLGNENAKEGASTDHNFMWHTHNFLRAIQDETPQQKHGDNFIAAIKKSTAISDKQKSDFFKKLKDHPYFVNHSSPYLKNK